MRPKIPLLKNIPGIPTRFGDELRSMTDEQLEVMAAGCTPGQDAAISQLTDEQLLAIVNGTPEGRRLSDELEVL